MNKLQKQASFANFWLSIVIFGWMFILGKVRRTKTCFRYKLLQKASMAGFGNKKNYYADLILHIHFTAISYR